MKSSIRNIVFIALLASFICSCRKEPTTTTYPGWTQYYNDDIQFAGTIAFDSHGNLWVGAYVLDGVSEYNGKTWTNYGVVNGYDVSTVASLVGDTLGNIWMAAECGLAKFNGTTWGPPPDTINSGINYFYIGSLAIDKHGTIWGVGGKNELYEFEGNKWVTFYSPIDSIYDHGFPCIAIDAQGNKWLGSYGAGLFKFDGTNWKNYNTKNSGILTDTISYLAIDSKGNKWFPFNNKLQKFDGTNWVTYPNLSNIYVIAVDQQDNIWLGTGFHGAVKFDGNTWTAYTPSNGNSATFIVNGITIDKQGNKWFATGGGGVWELKAGY
jgi:ligand-binding sensor domain-containing protein